LIPEAYVRLVMRLARSELKPLSRPLLAGIRLKRRKQPVRPEAAPVVHGEEPAGPFEVCYPEAMGDLLIFVPRSVESHLVDMATGGYGYSHVAVDCGEVDVSSGQRVMIESTMQHPVWRSRQDRYGLRPHVRIAMFGGRAGAETYCTCVRSRLGEQYDHLEALTWGAVDDPAKQICSDLAAGCLPADILLTLVAEARAGRLRRNAVSLHPRPDGKVGIFVSPNGFAQFFSAPPGHKVREPDVRISTIPQVSYFEPTAR
jgi:hypothetical protein